MVKSDQTQLGNIIICMYKHIHLPLTTRLTAGNIREIERLHSIEGVKENFSQYLKKTLVAPNWDTCIGKDFHRHAVLGVLLT